jgi:hypothetical protein
MDACNSDVLEGQWADTSGILRKVEFAIHMVKYMCICIQGSLIEVQTPPH